MAWSDHVMIGMIDSGGCARYVRLDYGYSVADVHNDPDKVNHMVECMVDV